MPQWNLVQQAERSPTGCFLCGTQKGPFIDLQMPSLRFGSAMGEINVPGWAYICVGSEENPGCAVQLGRMSEVMVDGHIYREQREQTESAHQEIAELRGLLSKKTVTIGEALPFLSVIQHPSLVTAGGNYS